jgi:polysaccharide export outer membrane protein
MMGTARRRDVIGAAVLACSWLVCTPDAIAQTGQPAGQRAAVDAVASLAPDYVIGVDDVLTVSFYKEEAMSGEVTVRPDGKISLPLLKDVPAAGKSPEQLNRDLEALAAKFLQSPNVTVAVKQVNSRKVYLLGEGIKPGSLPMNGEMNVLQAISMAGGPLEWAKQDRIEIVRVEGGTEKRYKFNYKQAIKGEKTEQNITLKPGDLIVVP